MKDEEKTKEELLEELMACRPRIARMEESNGELKSTGKAQFKWLVESSPIAIGLLEGDPPKTKFINPMCSRLFGYSIAEIPDIDHWWSLVFPDPGYRKQIMTEWNRKFEETSDKQFEFGPVERVVTCKDGSQKHIEFRTVSLGTTYLVFGIDLTELKRADEESREKEERFNALFNRSFDCVYVCDFDGHFLDANSAALDLLGYGLEELSTLDLAALLDKQQLTTALKTIAELNKTGSHRALMEFKLKGKDGQLIFVETKVSLIFRDQKPNAILGIGRDITARKEAETLLGKREEELKLRTVHLEESNTALTVLLRQRKKDKKDLEDKITSNIREMVNPYIEKLESTGLNETQELYLNLIKSQLTEIASPFLKNIRFSKKNFTPTELSVATLIREGKNSQDIAQLINISKKTVEFHRSNIRNKLGIINKKINLRTRLLSSLQY